MAEEINISYEEFVIGIAQGVFKFEVVNKRNYSKLYKDQFIGNIMTVLLVLIIAPIIVIPILCFMINKWILLLGFVGILLGFIVHEVNSKTRNPIKNLVSTTLSFILTATILIYFFTILNPFAFIFTCLLYQFFFLNLGDNLWNEIAKNDLIKDPDKYYFARDNNIIKIFSNI
jgi:hypothetical protein